MSAGLALWAQHSLTGEFLTRFREPDPWKKVATVTMVALGFSVLAGLVYGLSSSRRSESEEAPAFHVRPKLLLASAILFAALLVSYGFFGETSLVRWLWLLSGAALLLPLYRAESPRFIPKEIAVWEWLILGAATAIAFFFRFWRVTEFPSHVDNDVGVMGLKTLEVISGNIEQWTGLTSSGHPYASHQILAAGVRLFGGDHEGIVMFSVLAGTLTVPLVFLLGRLLFGRQAGLIAMAMLMGSYTHIHFSRILFGPIATLFVTLSLYLLLRALREGLMFWAALSGLTLGFGLHTYYSARISPLLAVAVLGAWAVWSLVSRKDKAAVVLTFALGSLVGLGPTVGFALKKPKEFSGRTDSVVLWSPDIMRHSMSKYATDSRAVVVREQVRRSFLTLYFYADQSTHFGFPRPMVGTLTAVLFTVGFGLCLARLKDPGTVGLLSWFLLTFIFGGVLTADPPFWPHLNIAMPAICLIAGLAGAYLMHSLGELSPGRHPALRAGAAGLLVFLAGHHWSLYMELVADNARPRMRASRFIASLPLETNIYIFSAFTKKSEETFRFFNPSNRILDGDQAVVEALPAPTAQPMSFLLFDRRELLDFLVRKFPGGVYREHSPRKPLQFVSYTVNVSESDFVPGYARELPRLASTGWWLLLGFLTAVGWFSATRLFPGRLGVPDPEPA